MAHSTRSIRLIVASLLAVLMIGGTYLATGPNPFFGMTRIAGAQSSEELLREYAAKDSDTDGLPDWQEALYGTDPLNPESFQTGIKDGEAVAQGLIEPKVAVRPAGEVTDLDSIPGTKAAPSSLTDRFAQTLLTQYLSNRGATVPTSEEIVTFVEAGIENLASESASPNAFTLAEIAVAADGTAALSEYAAAAERAFALNTVTADTNELAYFSAALKGDDAALAKIASIGNAYEEIANALMRIPVPGEARQAHLSIANALMHLSETSADMASMNTDPLRALMGIGLYDKYATELVAGFTNLNGVFEARQVSIPEGASGYYIVKTAASAAENN